ncbi:MAG TPA: sensor histidine kinase [Clostridia bacterium]|nr:sensor histidine kinase [Clostridia bacterium]
MVDLKDLDKIIERTIGTIENSKEQIYEIAEGARTEYLRVNRELMGIKNEVRQIIEEVDWLEKEEKKARVRLMRVSSDFQKFSEDDIKEAYESAQKKQIDLITMRERERTLRYRRDLLELSLKGLQNTMEKAENLISQVGTVLEFLGTDLQDISIKIGDIQQKQQLSMRVIRAQEEERRRVAREIHDGPAQSMANIVMRAEFCLKLLEHEPDRVKEELVSLQDLVRLSLQDVRKIIFDLRPMVLDDLGLVPAIKRYLTNYEEQHTIDTKFLFFGEQTRLTLSLEVALFRIIQESLNNVSKHSKASQVIIKLEILPNKVNIHIKDNGCGFDLDEVMNNSEKEGYGLMGMQERVELLDGELKITTAPGKGAEINLSVPRMENTVYM